jgi:O-methyltransferase involved in polyketide biosynthesis
VFMYFEDPQVKSLVLTLKNHFPSAELVFDAFSPFLVWANNLRVKRTKVGARCHWAMNNCKDLEGWCDGIRLLEEYYPFQGSEPRLGRARWVRYIPFFTKTIGVFRYCIGEKYNTLQNPGDMNAN